MADHKNDQENDDLENIGDKDEFLKGGVDAGSDLDEITFSDSEFVDLASDAPDPIDEILAAPLAELDPLDALDPLKAPEPLDEPEVELPTEEPADDFIPKPALQPRGESFLTDDELPDPEFTAAAPLQPDDLSPTSDQEVDSWTDPVEPAAPAPESAPSDLAGNQRLDPSRRRPRPRPRPRQKAAPPEDEIIFDDEDDFTSTLPDELPPVEPTAASLTAPLAPEPEPLPEPVAEPEPEPEPELEIEPEPDIQVMDPIAEAGFAPAGLGEIDESFDDLPDVPELESPLSTAPAAGLVIDPTPVPDFEAIAKMPEAPPVIAAGEADLRPHESSPPATAEPVSLPGELTDSPDVDFTTAELDDIDQPAQVKPAAGSNPILLAGKKLLGQLKPLEIASLIVIALGCLGGAFLFKSWSQSGLPPREISPRPAEEVPTSLRGSFVQIGQLEAYWRPEPDADPSKVETQYLPEISLTVDGDSAGYLLAIFRNAEGKLVDSKAQKITDGKFVSTDANSATLSAEVGLENEFVLASYRTDDRSRWQVTLRESSDNQEWTDLANFYFPADSR